MKKLVLLSLITVLSYGMTILPKESIKIKKENECPTLINKTIELAKKVNDGSKLGDEEFYNLSKEWRNSIKEVLKNCQLSKEDKENSESILSDLNDLIVKVETNKGQ